ncbi:MAG: branched-chain amino acid ABC transporter permease [Firmicutes bacterium]|nr:branched-chain amino acid ABC transporter permease [Bacillota bacterium]MDD4694622.1 branched-chain amino acid ABC transporter permease [Bacillota bacterium]
MKNTTNKKNLDAYLTLIAGIVLVLLNVVLLAGKMPAYYSGILRFVGINIILAVSLNLINGITGQFSLGHAGFMAVGAYVSALVSIHLGWPLILALFVGALAAALLGVLIGLPTLRLKGDYLAIATLGLGEIIRVVILNLDITKGARGLGSIPRTTNIYLVELVAVITILFTVNLMRSTHGRALLSIREDEIAAEAMGINTTFYKVFAFSAGAFFAGLAGGLFAHSMGYIAPSNFEFMRSIEILVMVVLGGLGSITGSVVAAFVLTILPEALRGFAQFRMVLYSALLIAIMLFRPSGLMGTRELDVRSALTIFKSGGEKDAE